MPPLDRSTLKSIYHMRNIDAYRFKCLSGSKDRLDVMLSHDWPLGIEQHGDTQALLRKKPFFRQEVEQNALGNPANREILDTVKPRFWFSAHLHVKFKATVQHGEASPALDNDKSESSMLIPSQITREKKNNNTENVDEGIADETKLFDDHDIDNERLQGSKGEDQKDDDSKPRTETEFHGIESAKSCTGPDLTDQMTKFLALDKCLPRRHYLSIMHVESTVPKEEKVLEYDPEWLAIVKKTNQFICTEKKYATVPLKLTEVDENDVTWVNERIQSKNFERGLSGLSIPSNFSQTAPIYSHPIYNNNNRGPPPILPTMGNPQTDELIGMLEMDHKLTIPFDEQVLSSFDAGLGMNSDNSNKQTMKVEDVEDSNEIDIDDIDETNDDGGGEGVDDKDENEINIDADDVSGEGKQSDSNGLNEVIPGDEATVPSIDAAEGDHAPSKKPRCNS